MKSDDKKGKDNMTVKEVIGVLKHAKMITLIYGDNSVDFDRNDLLAVEAFGRYVVNDVYALADGKEHHYEIDVLMRPVVSEEK